MDRDRVIKFTTRVAMVSILLLLYWVFAFVSMTVFDLKVFRENMTETFYMSVFGIFAVLGGSLVVNTILNLSKIAESLARRSDSQGESSRPPRRGQVAAFLLSFPLLFGLLYLGDHFSSAAKRDYLVDAARHVVERNRPEIERMADYSFVASYVNATADVLARISEEEEKFPHVSLLLADEVGSKPTVLQFDRNSSWDEEKSPTKTKFIFSCSREEREYLASALAGQTADYHFSANDGSYELYYPMKTGKRALVLYFSDYNRYGKLGS